MSASAATVVVLTLLSAFLPSSSFVRAPSATLRGQAPRLRRPSRFATPFPSTQQQSSRPRSPLRALHRTCRGWRPVTAPKPALYSSVGDGFDDVDPLEAGPDIDPLEAGADVTGAEPGVMEEEEYEDDVPRLAMPADGRGQTAPIEEDDADAAAMAALAAAAKDTATKMQQKKKKRKRADPFMPRGAPAPFEWQEKSQLEEGCRAHLVVIHTGWPEDQAMATSLITQVKERFGNLVNVIEEIEDGTDEEEGAQKKEAGMGDPFEVWLEGPEFVLYHARGECAVDIDQAQIDKILLDMHERVQDEAIIGLYCREVPQFRLQGLTASEQKAKQFWPI